MAAIVTDRLKLQLIDQLVTVLQDNSKPTYVGFGRSEAVSYTHLTLPTKDSV